MLILKRAACFIVIALLAWPAFAQTDAIDFSSAVMGSRESPDVRGWPIMAGITRVHFDSRESYERGNVGVEFPGRDQLQPGYGNQGAIAWTLWGGFNRGGAWVFAPLVECIRAYIPTGYLFAPNHIGDNLLYYSDALDARIARYQPKAGELIALVATTGDTRRQNAQPAGIPPKRTNVVLVPFAVGDYSFQGWAVPPVTTPPATTEPATPAPALTALTTRVQTLEGAVNDMRQMFAAVYGELQAAVDIQGKAIRENGARLETVENALQSTSKPVRCIAAANLGAFRIPISCRVE